MKISSATWSILSELLDEVFDLDPAARADWLARQETLRPELAAMLRKLLAADVASETADVLARLPRVARAPGATQTTTSRAGLNAGDRVGPYRLIRELGAGGMADVWLAERVDGAFERDVALKVPRINRLRRDLAARFARERDILARLEHPHIARLYDAGVADGGLPYLAMEFVDGRPITTWCDAQRLGVQARLRLFGQVLDAVQYAHANLVIHRDLKPSNVLITEDGKAHLLDFGIAKMLHEAEPGAEQLTQEQGRVLTLHYASPEQLRGDAITVASDVYSLGVLLYELLTGRYPYVLERKSLAALEEAILKGEPELASSRAPDQTAAKMLRGEVDAILAKSLKREPSQRYATANALAEDIKRHLAGERVLAQPDGVGYRMRKVLRRHRLGVAAAGSVLLALLGGATIAVVQAKRANDAAERAQVVKEFVIDVFKVNERGNPANDEMRQLPAELLLERGAKLIDTRFAGQPQLQAELYGVVAGILLNMGATELAAQYGLKRVDLLDALDAAPLQRAEAALLTGEALRENYRIADAEARARAALNAAAAAPALRVRARLLLADLMIDSQRHDAATSELDRVDEDLAAEPSLPQSLRARALFLRASLLTDINRFDQARPVYERAISAALAADGPSSRTASRMRRTFAGALLWRGHVAAGLAMYEEAFAAMRAAGGADDYETALAEASAAALHATVDDDAYEQADAVVARSLATLDRLGPKIPAWVRATVENTRGCMATRFGRVEEGYALLSRSAAVLRTTFPERRSGDCLGFAAMETGRHDEAEREFTEFLAHIARGPAGIAPENAHDYVTLANNRLMRGQLNEAREALNRAPRFAHMQGAVEDRAASHAQFITVAHARIDLEKGDYGRVLQQLEGLPDQRYMMYDTGLLRGEALCGQGKARAALPLMYAGLVRFERIERYAYSPTLAYWRARVGLCELSAGNRVRAQEFARLARDGFTGQSGVSPYYKVPLLALEQRLRGD